MLQGLQRRGRPFFFRRSTDLFLTVFRLTEMPASAGAAFRVSVAGTWSSALPVRVFEFMGLLRATVGGAEW
jgi:hypothetical protein